MVYTSMKQDRFYCPDYFIKIQQLDNSILHALPMIKYTYLEACYFSFPHLRTQPPKEQLLWRNKKDLMGRDAKQLEVMEVHDRLTLLTSLA